MKLYVIRHGKTKLNDEKKFIGNNIDEDINETGIKQAEEARKQIENLDIDLIICSPLLRAKHTCEIININHVPIIYDKRICERDMGILEGKELGEFYHTEFWNYHSQAKVEGLESVKHLFNRIKLFLDEIKEEYKDKNILLVTHGGISKGVYFYFNDIPEDGMVNFFRTPNCCIKEYEL